VEKVDWCSLNWLEEAESRVETLVSALLCLLLNLERVVNRQTVLS
jgi:hypothetical protein